MPLVTTQIKFQGCLACDNMIKAQVGDAVKIYLDPTKFENTSVPLNGTIVAIEEDPLNSANTIYTIEFNNDQLPTGITNIEQCDVENLVCQSCCDNLQQQIDEIRGEIESAYTFSLDGNELVIVNNATDPPAEQRLDISTIPAITVLDDLRVQGGNYSPVSNVVTIPIVNNMGVTVSVLTIDLSSIGSESAVTAFSFNSTTKEYEITSGGSTLSAPGANVDLSVPGQVTITDAEGDSATLNLTASGGNLTIVGTIATHESSDGSLQTIDIEPAISSVIASQAGVFMFDTAVQFSTTAGAPTSPPTMDATTLQASGVPIAATMLLISVATSYDGSGGGPGALTPLLGSSGHFYEATAIDNGGNIPPSVDQTSSLPQRWVKLAPAGSLNESGSPYTLPQDTRCARLIIHGYFVP